jgi:hypothetical protein
LATSTGLLLGRKIVVILLVVIAIVVGIAYSATLNNQTAQPSTSPTSCKLEDVVGNFTSTPQMNDTSSGPYQVTFYIQNLASQSTTITAYIDQNGFTQSVNWPVPASTTASFQTMISRAEDSLVLETSCGSSFTALAYYPTYIHHYEVTLYVSVGGAAT